ncbi:hypothetical protein [Streptomyces sp. ML-6]|uniref:hypothetical protein n=1 Tax=Streptomyces sp. ML-6 TaxID=2982693 RepID=UPI0024BF62EB|nr:hypothetical protein [Streptomyces sp. ML-6]MDK0521827.1 hypothetical protein [Streptomyces sp. ML-6]
MKFERRQNGAQPPLRCTDSHPEAAHRANALTSTGTPATIFGHALALPRTTSGTAQSAESAIASA